MANQDSTFWISEPAGKKRAILVHASWCRVCNDGVGTRSHNQSSANPGRAQWHGPYQLERVAVAAAFSLARIAGRSSRLCHHCLNSESVGPLQGKRSPKRDFLQGVRFWVQLAPDGTIRPHLSRCPICPWTELKESFKQRKVHRNVFGNDIWYGPFVRLTHALLKAEKVKVAKLGRRTANCTICGMNNRLRLVDDRLASISIAGPDDAVILASHARLAKQTVCLECGKGRKRLRAHLMWAHQMTREQYQNKWNLPWDHPTTATRRQSRAK